MERPRRRATATIDYYESSESSDGELMEAARKRRKKTVRDVLETLLPGSGFFNYRTYKKCVYTIMAYDDTATATPPPACGVVDVVARQCAQGKSTEAIAKSLDPQIREMLSSPKKFAARPTAEKVLIGAAGLVRMDKASLLTLLEARCNSAENFGITEKLEAAETRVTHVDSTEHFDLAQEILLGGDIATLAEQFSDDFDV